MRRTNATSLKLARTAAGLRIIDAARHLGRRENWLSRVESGDNSISYKDCERLAELYGIEVGAVLGRQPLVLLGIAPVLGST